MTDDQIKRAFMASYEAMVDDSIPTREGEGKGRHGGWNKGKNDRVARGHSPEAWANYQRRVEGVW